ncbi:hypothetical protein SHIRM173S_11637 [Streptomyces hirsutus]
MTKQAASQLVDELVRKGYAERRPHPADARARLVVLTGSGLGLYAGRGGGGGGGRACMGRCARREPSSARCATVCCASRPTGRYVLLGDPLSLLVPPSSVVAESFY